MSEEKVEILNEEEIEGWLVYFPVGQMVSPYDFETYEEAEKWAKANRKRRKYEIYPIIDGDK